MRFQRLADFPSFGEHDRLGRYMVTVRRKRDPDAAYAALVPHELARVGELQQQSRLQFFSVAAPNDPHWVGWLFFRAATLADVRSALESLPLYPYLDFTIQEAARV